MFITLTIIALLIQLIGVYALLIQTQRMQDTRGQAPDPANPGVRPAGIAAYAEPQADRSHRGGWSYN